MWQALIVSPQLFSPLIYLASIPWLVPCFVWAFVSNIVIWQAKPKRAANRKPTSVLDSSDEDGDTSNSDSDHDFDAMEVCRPARSFARFSVLFPSTIFQLLCSASFLSSVCLCGCCQPAS